MTAVTAAEELTRDLYANLVDQYYDTPARYRKRCCWVMNREWFEECRKIGRAPWECYGWPQPGCTTMLGLPFAVTEDGGFPHLIAD
jgi:predicted phage gp36 major capsid-like protein